MRILMWFIERIALIAAIGGIVLAIAAGIWTGLKSKFDETVDKEVDRRIKNTKIITHFNVNMSFIEDPLIENEEM